MTMISTRSAFAWLGASPSNGGVTRKARLAIFGACIAAAAGLVATMAGGAAADTVGTITFGSPYTLGNINGQQDWSNTGSYDANVVNTARYGFGQALQISDAYTSGNFGDQTFSPALQNAAGETTGFGHFEASFKIGTTQSTEQSGLHMSVSPDSGNGDRMSYLRFEDQADGVHVHFMDATDAGPNPMTAAFNDTDIATLGRDSSHTVKFSIDFKAGPANDVVKIYIDGTLAKTGTSWEDYYRYDPEQAGSGNAVPSVSKLLFREAGDAHSANSGNGFLIDDVTLSSAPLAPECMPTGFNNLTAAQIGGTVSGNLDATGCDIGVYYGPGSVGSVSGANIYGAKYYGVVADQRVLANVTNSSIHQIGDNPFDGNQNGRAVFYTNGATGTVSGNQIYDYQKNGVVATEKASVQVLNNTVTGRGHLTSIAQNGVVILNGATALIKGNTISHNWYTPTSYTSYGLLLINASGVRQQSNSFSDNESNLGNFGRGGGSTSA